MRIFGLFLVAFSFFACVNKQKEAASSSENTIPLALRPSPEKQAKMVFDQPLVYLGRIKEGEQISYTFHFKNKGNMPLQILSVNASCGCTTPKWSKELVQPDKKGFIKVTFDSKGKEGKLQKTVTVYANTLPADNQVAFKIEVLPNTK
ncbi:DUF1573 domain-containing protein [Aquirufa sp. OSTEICH-129V]|uniref:DUF1573 domain-containing protein n=1 Tax=Aquirufa avitistagni TaxID=3104728 RepID=A0ABW6DEF3_9BACT